MVNKMRIMKNKDHESIEQKTQNLHGLYWGCY